MTINEVSSHLCKISTLTIVKTNLQTIKFLQCRWLISQNIAQFSTCKTSPKFLEDCKKLYLSELEETFSIPEVFMYFTFGQGVLRYVHQENL